jgi:hypothetical protein
MKNGIFKIQYSSLNEIITLFLIIISYIISIINPISWLVYLIIYKGISIEGKARNTNRIRAQLSAFLISILSYIILIVYIIYKAIKQ